MKKKAEEIKDLNYYEKHTNEYKSLIKLLGKDENFINVFGFDRTIYTLEHYTNLDELNECLLNFINDMKKINIDLDFNNFNYSYYSLCYMEYFFNVIDSKDFLSLMKDKYLEISKQCKILNIHLKLCIRTLINNNSKIIYKELHHVINKKISKLHIKENDIYANYSYYKIKYDELLFKENYFKQNPGEKDYNNKIKNIIEKLIDYKEYKKNPDLFYKNVEELLHILEERLLINKYSYIFNKCINIKDKYIDEYPYKSYYKQLNSLEKDKYIIDYKVENIINKINRCHDEEKIDEFNNILKDLNDSLYEVISSINKIMHELYYLNFKHSIKVLKNNTLYDVIYYLSHHFYIMYDMLSNNIDDLDEFRHIQYNPYLYLIKNIDIKDYMNIDNIIKDKYGDYFKIDIFDDKLIEYLNIVNNYRIMNEE